MSDEEVENFVKKLQKEIIDKEIENFNEKIVEIIQNPTNWGKPPDKEISVFHAYEGPCGDTMHYFLNIKDGIIKKANFITDGCGATVAAGNETMQMIEGKALEFAENLKPEDIDDALNGLPDAHKHCAELAIRTLTRSIEKYKYNEI